MAKQLAKRKRFFLLVKKVSQKMTNKPRKDPKYLRDLWFDWCSVLYQLNVDGKIFLTCNLRYISAFFSLQRYL